MALDARASGYAARVPDHELKAAGELAAEFADRALISPIQSVHLGVAERVFSLVGRSGGSAEPTRVVHDRISAGVYGAIRRGAAGIGVAVGAGSRFVGGEEERTTLSDTGFGRGLQAAVNGLIGDELAERDNGLAIEMAVRLPGRDVEIERSALEAAFTRVTGRIAIFVHGLCEGEEAWWMGTRSDPSDAGAEPERAPRTYGQRLRDDLDFTPLYLRYNSGLHISANGRSLSWLLEDLCREWPVPVEEVVLIGHSMGGLVARSACHEAHEAHDGQEALGAHGVHEGAGRGWLERASHVICLGSPNTGSWLEKVVHVGTSAMRRAPETRGIADFFDLRSDGIRDLRFGYLRDDDWLDADADEWLADRSEPLAPVPGVSYHFISGSLARGPRNPLGHLLGDVLVRRESAMGPRTPDGAPAGDHRHVEGASHFHLLNHPDAYEHIREWIAGDRAEPGSLVSLKA